MDNHSPCPAYMLQYNLCIGNISALYRRRHVRYLLVVGRKPMLPQDSLKMEICFLINHVILLIKFYWYALPPTLSSNSISSFNPHTSKSFPGPKGGSSGLFPCFL